MCVCEQDDEMGRAFSRHGERRNACRILVGKLEGRRRLGKSGRCWNDNIKSDLGEIGWRRVGLE
jgi:hypothetical protein